MNKILKGLGTISDRITAETPVYFKRIINVSLVSSSAAVALLAAPFHISEHLHTICENVAVVGIAAAAISKTAKIDPPQAPKDDTGKAQ